MPTTRVLRSSPADHRHADQVREVARAGRLLGLGHRDPALLGQAGGVHVIDLLLGVARESTLEDLDGEEPGVALGHAAEVIDSRPSTDVPSLVRPRSARGRAPAAGSGRAPRRPRPRSTGTFTAMVTTPPVSAATHLFRGLVAGASVASAVEAPRCGVTMTFG